MLQTTWQKMWFVCVGLILVVRAVCAHAAGTSLIFELPDKEKTCFYHEFKGASVGKSFVFEYRVIRGGNNDIDAWVVSPNGKLLYKELRLSAGIFTFDSSRGDFRFCFGNEFSTFTHKVVSFDLRNEEVANLDVEAGVTVPTVKGASETSCDNIHTEMTTVVNYQREFRLKEALGRHLAERMNQNVSWWSIGQTVVILLTGLGQVFILKTFFTEKSSTVKVET
ncbi:hypothetical protein FSP39_019503 [Pinctada imbricata]|uniref:GOLD domain-containing protein n=1 Tax=Pinctada imbricata TaxID=66713 RepID=A0AA88Y7L0_PINIB|nr:hypothetical protein FSP39_019503 [Pinctada imbricata]